MIIYENVKKNTKIAVFSIQDNILDEVLNKLENDEFNVEKYNDIDKLKDSIVSQKIKIVIFLDYDIEKIKSINEINNDILIILVKSEKQKIKYKELEDLDIQNIVDIERLNNEIVYSLRIISQEEKLDFQKLKLDIVGNLVESISHQIQANLLVVGASLDVIKMLAEDENINQNIERKNVLNSLYLKNSESLQRANLLLQLMSDAASISSESIMQYDDVIDLIKLILDEFIKENNTILNINSKIRNGTYICGPLNDVIFMICKIIQQLVNDENKNVNLLIKEDEFNWYFEITTDTILSNKDKLLQINKYSSYIKDAKFKITDKKIIVEIKKIK